MGLEKIQNKIDSVQVPLGYGMSGGLTSTPLWLEPTMHWLQWIGVLIGVLIGITTLYINFLTIKDRRNKKKSD